MRASAVVLGVVLAGFGASLAMALETSEFGVAIAPTDDPVALQGPVSTQQGPAEGAQALAEGAQATTDVEPESCVAPAAAYQDMARRFADDPEGFVERYSSFDASVAVPLRNAIMTDPSLVPLAIELIRASGSESERARQMAVGLGQAALLCAATAPNTALEIQEAVLELQDDFVAVNFAAAAGDTGTGALRGGAGGGSGSAGGGAGPGLTASSSLGASGPWTIGSAPQPEAVYNFSRSGLRLIFETSRSSSVESRTTP